MHILPYANDNEAAQGVHDCGWEDGDAKGFPMQSSKDISSDFENTRAKITKLHPRTFRPTTIVVSANDLWCWLPSWIFNFQSCAKELEESFRQQTLLTPCKWNPNEIACNSMFFHLWLLLVLQASQWKYWYKCAIAICNRRGHKVFYAIRTIISGSILPPFFPITNELFHGRQPAQQNFSFLEVCHSVVMKRYGISQGWYFPLMHFYIACARQTPCPLPQIQWHTIGERAYCHQIRGEMNGKLETIMANRRLRAALGLQCKASSPFPFEPSRFKPLTKKPKSNKSNQQVKLTSLWPALW